MPFTARYYGSASSAATDQEVRHETTVGEFKLAVITQYGDQLARILSVASILVNGQATTGPDQAIPDQALVDVLPPFAGG